MPVGGVGSTARYVSAETSEEWVQGRLESEELIRAGLASPATLLGASSAQGVSAETLLDLDSARQPGVLEVVPGWKRKAERAARLALAFIGAPPSGRLEIECAIATGVGLGSSTSDVVAAIRAVCDFHRASLDARDVARLAVEAEGAADPLMFDAEMVLFAQRQGRVLESFGCWVPRYTLLSIDTDAGGAGVDTLSLPLPIYSDAELSALDGLLARVRKAFAERDVSSIAAVATQSAALNQRFLSMRHFDEIRELADEYRALGVQISHSGTVAGVLFDETRGVHSDPDLAAQLFERVRSLGLRPLGLFATACD
jgi:uncharacterized protein involved in propanediol utilization